MLTEKNGKKLFCCVCRSLHFFILNFFSLGFFNSHFNTISPPFQALFSHLHSVVVDKMRTVWHRQWELNRIQLSVCLSLDFSAKKFSLILCWLLFQKGKTKLNFALSYPLDPLLLLLLALFDFCLNLSKKVWEQKYKKVFQGRSIEWNWMRRERDGMRLDVMGSFGLCCLSLLFIYLVQINHIINWKQCITSLSN